VDWVWGFFAAEEGVVFDAAFPVCFAFVAGVEDEFDEVFVVAVGDLRMQLEYKPLPLKTQLPYLRPTERINFRKILED